MMTKSAFVALATVVPLLLSQQFAFGLQTSSTDYYTAGSMIHTPLGFPVNNHTTVQGIIDLNLQQYAKYIDTAAKASADILLFPESGTGFLQVPHAYLPMLCEPMPEVGAAFPSHQCQENTGFGPNVTMADMPHYSFSSCQAQKHGLDIVINYCGVDNKTGKRYNLDVGFTANNGKVGAVYRKSHITGTGPYLSQPLKPDPVVFNASFGVTFGMFTCYDFWFVHPMRTEMESMGVRHFLFPNEMSSSAPIAMLQQQQQGWSMFHEVNLVASTSFGNGGAGIYTMGTTVSALAPNISANGMFATQAITFGRLPKVVQRGISNQGLVSPSVKKEAEAVVEETIVVAQSEAECVYGPPINGLNFTFPCVKFHPSRLTKRTKFNFEGGVYNTDHITTLNCTGSIVIGAQPGAGGDGSEKVVDETWILGAIVVTSAGNIQTPSGLTNAFCMLYRCDDPSGGCMGMDPSAGYRTQLTNVSSVSIRAAYGGIMNATTSSIYPAAALHAAKSPTYQPMYFSPKNMTLRSDLANNAYTLHTDASMAPSLKTENFYSFGFYGTASYKPYY